MDGLNGEIFVYPSHVELQTKIKQKFIIAQIKSKSKPRMLYIYKKIFIRQTSTMLEKTLV